MSVVAEEKRVPEPVASLMVVNCEGATLLSMTDALPTAVDGVADTVEGSAPMKVELVTS